MVGQVADLVSTEMAVRVEDFGFVVEIVVEMVMKAVGFDLEFVDFVDFEKMEDNDNI